jgi:hypothetical protein
VGSFDGVCGSFGGGFLLLDRCVITVNFRGSEGLEDEDSESVTAAGKLLLLIEKAAVAAARLPNSALATVSSSISERLASMITIGISVFSGLNGKGGEFAIQ